MDPSAAPAAPQGGGSPMGMPDVQAQPLAFGGPPLPVQGPDPDVVTIDQVMALLRNDALRGFRIDVETDSLVEADQQAEKQQRTEFVQSVGEFLAKVGPIAQAMPPLAPLVGGLLQFAVRGFKVGQELEELIETSMHKAGMILENPKPPQPSPDELAKIEGIKAKTQAEIQKAQMEMQTAVLDMKASMMDAQSKAQGDAQKHQFDIAAMGQKHQLEMARLSAEVQTMREKHHMEMASKQVDLQHKGQAHDQAMEQKQADAEQRKADAKKKDAN